jgi:hypothetical protein
MNFTQRACQLLAVSFLVVCGLPVGAQTTSATFLDLMNVSVNDVFGANQQQGGLFVQGGFGCAVQAGATCGTNGGYTGVAFNPQTNPGSYANSNYLPNLFYGLAYANGANQINFTAATSYFDSLGQFSNPQLYNTTNSAALNLVNPLAAAGLTSFTPSWTYRVNDLTNNTQATVSSLQTYQNPTSVNQNISLSVVNSNGVVQLATPTPFVQNVSYSVNAQAGGILTPTFNWSQAAGYTPGAQRIQIWQLNANGPSTQIFGSTLAGSATSFAVPTTFADLFGQPTSLQVGARYAIDIESLTLRNPGSSVTGNDNVLSRSRSFFDFTPTATTLAAGQPVALPMVNATGSPTGTPVYQFSQSITSGQPLYIDPAVATGYRYDKGVNDPNFTSVTPATTIGTGVYKLFLLSGGSYTFAATLSAGQTYHFGGSGVTSFEIQGIDPNAAVDPSNASAFVTGLTFASAGSFTGTMTPLTAPVPLPAAAWLMLGGMSGLGAFVRKKRPA